MVSVSEKKVSALIPIPKLDLGFGSRYQNTGKEKECYLVVDSDFFRMLIFNSQLKKLHLETKSVF